MNTSNINIFPIGASQLLFVKKQIIQFSVLPFSVSPYCLLPQRNNCHVLTFVQSCFYTSKFIYLNIRNMRVICMKHKLFVYFQRLMYFTFNVACGILAITTFTVKHFVFRIYVVVLPLFIF